MKKLIFIYLLFISALIHAQINQVDANGKKQGSWEKKHPKSSVLHYKGQFKDDKPVGVFTYYYLSNKIQAVIKHDLKTGRSEATFYHENGNILSQGIFKNMKKDSVWCNYVPSGRLSSKETYKNDVLDGKMIVYYVPEDLYDKTQQVYYTCNYLNGKLDGEKIEYFQGGKLKSKGNYRNNIKVGVWEEYHPNGRLMMTQRYLKGERHGWWISYGENGQETGRTYYYEGTRLEGKELEKKLKELKAKGIDPNGGGNG